MGRGAAMAAALAVVTGSGFMHAPITLTTLGAMAFPSLVSSIAGFAGYVLLLDESLIEQRAAHVKCSSRSTTAALI